MAKPNFFSVINFLKISNLYSIVQYKSYNKSLKNNIRKY